MLSIENVCLVIFEIESIQSTAIEKHEELCIRSAFLRRFSYGICKLTEKSVRIEAFYENHPPVS